MGPAPRNIYRLVLPEADETRSSKLGIAHGRLNRAMPEIILDRAGVAPIPARSR
jgi:hypothetical protein